MAVGIPGAHDALRSGAGSALRRRNPSGAPRRYHGGAPALQAQATLQLKQILHADTEREALRLRERFQTWCRTHGLDEAAALIERDWDRMVAFYRFPKERGVHLRTTNVVESPFAALWLRTDAAKRFRKVGNATAVIFEILRVA